MREQTSFTDASGTHSSLTEQNVADQTDVVRARKKVEYYYSAEMRSIISRFPEIIFSRNNSAHMALAKLNDRSERRSDRNSMHCAFLRAVALCVRHSIHVGVERIFRQLDPARIVDNSAGSNRSQFTHSLKPIYT